MSASRASAEASGERSDESNSGQRTANLARIRDNQRRSRARRKEYLQELEQKYRVCEQSGVEASAEIQTAARRVIDENKRLRGMLLRLGMSEHEIDGQMTDAGDISAVHDGPSAHALEQMLKTRRQCGTDSSGCNSPTTQSRNQTRQQQQPPSHIATTSSSQRTIPPNPAIHHYAAPLSNEKSPTSMLPLTPTNYPALPNSYMASIHHHHQQLNSGYTIYPPIWQQTPHPQIPSNDPIDPQNSSSCYIAANAIRTIKPDAGQELENELCSGEQGDCNVPNTQIFSIMDRYSGGV
ncbi:Hypothetical protein R9X50_00729200 [Acrodontium crateriforme]|uniref:BZIP domain-containing protein n=1 Tax=Acrodontium crateriforme TaxID=150365 RepID=A0AAQ3R7I2_9PEZI|nr:Hypothetical protein R9X50_00729200 [Acrodontium crateriforme]